MPTPALTLILFAAVALIGLFASIAVIQDVVALLARAVGLLPKRPIYGAARSGKWPALERNWLKVHPHCAACGTSEQVSVHHKRPFHLHPDLELDPANLITLCEKHCCHLMHGHNGDWHAYNPHVEEDTRFFRRRVEQRKYE